MRNALCLFIVILLLLLLNGGAYAQREPISWDIHSDSVKAGSAAIMFKATLVPGWHLYSQLMDEGGPMPTTFTFDKGTYDMVGPTIENGKRTTYHDSIYDMEVSWYADTVTFSQAIRINFRTVIKGSIDYMVCNNELCMPGRKTFAVLVGLPVK